KEPDQEGLPGWDAAAAPQAAEPAPAAASTAEMPVAPPAADSVGVSPAPAAGQLCPHCNAPRDGAQSYCDNCGWIFPPTAGPAEPAVLAAPADPAAPLGG